MKNSKYIFFKCLVVIVFTIFTCNSCTYFNPELRQNPDGKIPNTFSLYSKGPKQPDKWWESFNDHELNQLIETSLKDNLSLKEAWARLMLWPKKETADWWLPSTNFQISPSMTEKLLKRQCALKSKSTLILVTFFQVPINPLCWP